jgi:AraC-like DNA-binding protein
MRPGVPYPDGTDMWGVARPSRPSRVPGVTMAGFRDRGTAPVDLRAVTHPAITLAVQFGDGPLIVEDAAGNVVSGSVVVGLAFGTLHVRGEGIECIQVRLSPVTAHALLGASSAELDGKVATLDDLWGRDASRIGERLRDTPSWEDRFAIIDAALTRRYEAGPSVDPETARAWERIVTSRGQVRIDELTAELGWSRKRLWARFRSHIGLAPKRAAMLARFDAAAHHLASGLGAARVAAELGYVDQSHLHRDVVTFTGQTPATVAGEPFLAVDDLAWAGQA